MRIDERGQAVLELALILPLLVLAIGEAFWLLHTTVRRTECARVVFDTTRAALESEKVPVLRNGVMIQTVPDGLIGRKKCGTHVETQFIPHLGSRNPGVSPSDS